MQLTTDQIDAIRKKFHPDDMPSRLLVRSIAEFLVELLAAHNAGAQEPVGYCVEGENHCVCGGDLPRVREGCGNWRKVTAQPQSTTDAARESLHRLRRKVAALPHRQIEIGHAVYKRVYLQENVLNCVDAEIERLDRSKGE